MTSAIASLVVACALALPGVLLAAPPHEHDHASHAVAADASAAAPAQRFATDASLRKGMGEVHAALSDLRHFDMGHMPATMAGERAGDIVRSVQTIFAECRLAPDADAALHAILVPLLGAAKRLEQDGTDLAAVAAMRDAVASYPRRFDDPQWTDASEPAHGH